MGMRIRVVRARVATGRRAAIARKIRGDGTRVIGIRGIGRLRRLLADAGGDDGEEGAIEKEKCFVDVFPHTPFALAYFTGHLISFAAQRQRLPVLNRLGFFFFCIL